MLIDASSDAELLVVGRHEHTAWPRLVGSVTHQCVHHARCPVAVEPWGLVVTPRDRRSFEQTSRDLIDTMVANEIAHGAAAPRWSPRVVEDASAPGLVGVAVDADLLVVGSRGRGGFAALLIGSTSWQSLHHATCPVAIIRGERAT